MNINKFLLGALWTTALALALDFWLDIRFGFNMFLRGHWAYLAGVQTGSEIVHPLFYGSLFAFAILLPFGLYMISRPSRRIILERKTEIPRPYTPAIPTAVPAAAPAYPAYPAAQSAAIPTRPPSVTVPSDLHITNPVEHISTPPRANTVRQDYGVQSAPAPDSDTIQRIVTSAGYIMKKPPRTGGYTPDIWAIGADEVLIIGKITAAPGALRTLEALADKVCALIADTLDESVQIQVRTFVVDDIDSLREWADANKSRPVTDDEREDFDAYSEYMDSITGYFDNK
ncbi:MAG: hypothetical protein FWE17_00730 [Alphaproteobacteria bacterium]|nr:hypothetical protein [Alphaproteobacteria bacterium]MCL2758218.1 hypothetical protein [Alphaproteobacteria bacterium]